jgi:regulator of protease activity HflC (stomatin/prohibitin superfamily)
MEAFFIFLLVIGVGFLFAAINVLREYERSVVLFLGHPADGEGRLAHRGV